MELLVMITLMNPYENDPAMVLLECTGKRRLCVWDNLHRWIIKNLLHRPGWEEFRGGQDFAHAHLHRYAKNY